MSDARPERISLAEKLAASTSYWDPKLVVELGAGEMAVVPRGVEHRPVAVGEVHLLLFEPASTLNTGNVRNERTVERLGRL